MTQYLRAATPKSRPIGVDRDKNILRGYVLAQQGPFKSEGRGEFDEDSLKAIIRLGNTQAGLKSRLGHPTMSDDGIGKFLGRARDLSMSTATDARTGKSVPAVRGDLHFDKSASKTPSGDLADYVLSLAESDPDSFSSSLVLEVEQEFRIDTKGRPLTDAEGNELPPLWKPTAIHASDIVDTGDAVDSVLSPAELAKALDVGLTPELEKMLRFDRVARFVTQLLNGQFPKAGKDEVRERCMGWLDRYLSHRFPEPEAVITPRMDRLRERMTSLQT